MQQILSEDKENIPPNKKYPLSRTVSLVNKPGSVSLETLQWRQQIENRLKRVDDLEKSVLLLRSELIDEVRRRKSLESMILSKEEEIANLMAFARDKKRNGKDINKVPLSTPVSPTRKDGGFDESNIETLISWLNSNGLSDLVNLYIIASPTTVEDSAPIEPGYSAMFQRIKDQLKISLSKCGISKLLDWIFLSEDDPLSKIWDRKFFIRDFIIVHQAVMSPQQLFKFLTLKCCSTGATTATILMTSDFIKNLVRYLKIDIRSNESWGYMINQLAGSIGRVNADVSKDILKYLDGIYTTKAYCFPASESDMIPEIVLQKFTIRYEILELEQYPYEFACQLTYIEQQYIFKTEIKEFLHQAWTSDKIPTPNLDKYIEFTNRVTGIFSKEILVQPVAKSQAQVINYLIEVANNLYKINNFNGLQMVLACLHSSAVTKLKSAWSFVSKKSKEDFERYTELMNPQNHYRAYEEALQSIDEQEFPVIPLLSMPLRDLFLIEEALQTVVPFPRGWINFDKLSKISKIIWNFRKYQLKYNFIPIQVVVDYIEEKADSWDSKVSYAVAKLREENADVESTNLSPISRVTPKFLRKKYKI